MTHTTATATAATPTPAAIEIAMAAFFCNLTSRADACRRYLMLTSCVDVDADPEQIAGLPLHERCKGEGVDTILDDLRALAANVDRLLTPYRQRLGGR